MHICPHCVAIAFMVFGSIFLLFFRHVCISCKFGFHKWLDADWISKKENKICECCHKTKGGTDVKS
jgi:hypothetical protein